MSDWRYNRNGRPSDPVDQPTLAALIKDGTLPPDSLVWREGMPDWVKASSLPEFSAAATPPVPPTTAIVSVPDNAVVPPSAPPIPPPPAPGQTQQSATIPDPAPEPQPQPPRPPVGRLSPAAGLAAEQADIEQNRIFAVLAYLGILFLVPLLAAPKSRFARFHTNQGVVLFIGSIAAYAAVAVFALVAGMIPIVGCLAFPLMLGVIIGTLVLVVMGVVNAASGTYKPLPLIGHFELMKTDPGA